MKKYIIINSSPREGANSEAITNKLVTRIEENGAKAEIFAIKDKTVAPCLGCNHCKASGQCVHKDDATKLIASIGDCAGIVLVSPIYFGDVTGTCKVLIDRFYALFNPAKGPTKVVEGRKFGIALTFGGSPLEAIGAIAEKTAACFGVTGIDQHKAILCSGNNDKEGFSQNKEQQKAVEELANWLL